MVPCVKLGQAICPSFMLIKSDKTEHVARQNGAALIKTGNSDRTSQKQLAHPKRK
jgi:hypothetical protein